MTARRFFSVGGAAVVGVIAGIASFTHMRDVGLATHQGVFIASLVPLSVDGLVLVATLAIGDGRKSTFTAWVAFLVGVGVSLAANVAAADPTALARCWSAWPSAGFLLAVEVLIRGGRKAPLPEAPPTVVPTAAVAVNVKPVVPPSGIAIERPSVAVKPAATPAPSRRVPNAAKRTTTTAEKVARAAAKTPDASAADLARRLRLGETTVRRHLAAITTAENPVSEHVNGHTFEAEEATR